MKGTDWRGVTEDQIAAHINRVAEGRTARRLPGAKLVHPPARAMATSQGGVTVLRVPRELLSVNKLVGRHWRVKHRESQGWEKAIRSSLCDLIGAKDFPSVLAVMMLGTKRKGEWVSRCEEKKRVTITRQVPSARRFIRDDDNLVASCKPVIDALKRIQLIRDDARKWLELVVTPQQLSADSDCWTVIEIRTP